MNQEITPPLIPVTRNKTSCSNCSVRRLALFHNVPAEDLAWTETFRENQFQIAPHQIIAEEGKPCDYLFTVYHGWFAIYKALKNGKRHILRVALPGDILCFQANMFNAPMTYSVESLSEGLLCAFPKKTLPEVLTQNHFVANRLSEMNARDMSMCQSNLLAVAQKSAKEKIAHFCIEIYFRIKVAYPDIDKSNIFFPLSQEEIGDATGLTKIHVNRTLKKLKDEKLLEIKSKRLNIIELDELCTLSEFDKSHVNVYSLYDPNSTY